MAFQPEPLGPADAAALRANLLSGNALGMVSMLFWAAGFPAAELLLDTWPPVALIAARLLMVLVLLLPLWLAIDGVHVLANASWRRGIWVGGIGFGFGTWLLLISQSLTDPVTVALIASAMPIAATLIELFYRVRRPSRLFLIGMAASVTGGIIATWGKSPTDFGLGGLAAVASCFLFAWASFCTVRDLPNLTALGRTTLTFIGAAIVVVILFLGTTLAGVDVMPRAPVDGRQITLLIVYAIGAMALSQVCFIAAIARLGVAVTSLHINIAPFYVMVIMTVLGATWSWQQAFGAAIVGLGVIVSQRR